MMVKRVQIPLETYSESLEAGMDSFLKELRTVIEVEQTENGLYHLQLIVCLSEEVANEKTKAA